MRVLDLEFLLRENIAGGGESGGGVCDMQQTWPTEQRSRQKEKICQVIKHSSFYLIVMELQLWNFFYITLHSYYLLSTADQTGKQAFF